jgi:hypothetical protein
MTINEALVHLKILKQRHGELVSLRNDNANTERRYYGSGGDKEVVKEPTYDVKKVDLRVVNLTKEMRKLELAIKGTNATTQVQNYSADETVLDGIE